MKYPQITEGEWVTPKHRGFKLGCCDCGLIHIYHFRIRDGAIQFRVYIDERATAAMRRPMKFIKDDD